MNISGHHPWDAVRDGLLSEPQTNNLWEYLLEKTEEVPYFRMAHILYHLGGFIAMVVMTFFMNLGRGGLRQKGYLRHRSHLHSLRPASCRTLFKETGGCTFLRE